MVTGNGTSWRWVLLTAAIGVLASLTLFFLLRRADQRRDDAEFNRQVSSYLAGLEERRNAAEDVLRTLRALFHQAPRLDRRLFTNVVEDLSIRLDGVQLIGWARRVTLQQRPELEEAVRREGFQSFQIIEGDITHPTTERPSRASSRPEYFPMVYMVPLEGNEVAFGYDLASDPTVRELLQRADSSGEIAISGPVNVPYRNEILVGVLVTVPVYSPDFRPSSEVERQRQLQGYVVGVFVLDELMKAIEARRSRLALDVMVVDVTDRDKPSVMNARVDRQRAKSLSPDGLGGASLGGTHSVDLKIGGRDFRFVFRRGSDWDRGLERWIPGGVLVIGLLLTALLAQLLRESTARASRIEAIVHTRTAELGQANAKLQKEIQERVATQNLLTRERGLLYLLLHQLPDAVFVTDREENYVLANQAHARLLGEANPEALAGRPVAQVGPSQLIEVLGRGLSGVLRSGLPVREDAVSVETAAGEVVQLEISRLPFRDAQGEIDGLLVITRDVTAQKRAEVEKQEFSRRLQEGQKLESLGVLAGGVAHDFNNLLTTILGNASLARMELPPSSPAQDCLRQIETTSIRAADLCKQMLAYSGKGRFVVRRVDLSQLVEQMAELLKVSVSKKATLQLNLGRSLPAVMADATQLQQILMNLVINASEALGGEGGTIEIRTGLTRADRDYIRQLATGTDIAEGSYLFLEVTDNGCGMSSEVQSRIFDPFFSTKFIGRGLGLPAVMGIARGHRGAILVRSQPGKGSTFRLLLPCAEGAAEPEKAAAKAGAPGKLQGTVLLADDEEAVRSTMARLLAQAGLTVHEAENGRSALEKFRAAPDLYAAVLLDLTMPQLDGEETFREIRQLRPGARVLLLSGFSAQEAADRFAGQGLDGFLQKPFMPEQLIESLRAVMQ
jgi:PAS domain S-box-containing protein